MIRYWPALASVLLPLGAITGYVAFLRVPAVRNHPELYLLAFAVATVIAAAATWQAARWPNFVALGLSVVLLILGGYFNFVLAKIPRRRPCSESANRRPTSRCRTRKEHRSAWPPSASARRSSWSSIAATGDPSAWRSSKDLGLS